MKVAKMTKDFVSIDKCLLCDNKIEMILPLATTPLANELLETKQEQDIFPLNLVKCVVCNHLQLDTIIDKERLYRQYFYCSDTSAFNREYFKSYANDMLGNIVSIPWHLTMKQSNVKVLDIASNDGLFLSYFKERDVQVLGIDPAKNIAEKATVAGIPTIPDFFNEETASKILREHGKFDLITCNNAFAHNADLRPIVKGVEMLLKDDGSFVFEISYAMRLLENGIFDLIYHEHQHHHHIIPLFSFLEDNGLRIYDAEERPTHGGSIRIYACKKDARFYLTRRCEDLMLNEHEHFNKLVDEFAPKVEANKNKLVALLKDLKSQGKTISILGYPAKATTLAYYFETDNTIIDDVFDDNPLKQGKWTPGGQWKVRSTNDIEQCKPDYLLILAWNYAEELMKTHKAFRQNGGHFIIPLPVMRIE